MRAAALCLRSPLSPSHQPDAATTPRPLRADKCRHRPARCVADRVHGARLPTCQAQAHDHVRDQWHLLRGCRQAERASALPCYGQELWGRCGLVGHDVRAAEMRCESYRGTWLGSGWFLAQPVLFLFAVGYIRVAVFDRAWHRPDGSTTSTTEFIAALFIGLTAFWFASEPLSRAPAVLREYGAMVKNEIVPTDGLITVITLEAIFNTALRLGLLLAGFLLSGIHLSVHALAVPLLLFPLLALNLGVGWLFARAGVRYRDLEHVTPPLFAAMFFMSAVFYPVYDLPIHVQELFLLNPIAFTAYSIRGALLWQQWPEWQHLGALSAFALLLLWSGWYLFYNRRGSYADAI